MLPDSLFIAVSTQPTPSSLHQPPNFWNDIQSSAVVFAKLYSCPFVSLPQLSAGKNLQSLNHRNLSRSDVRLDRPDLSHQLKF